MKRFAGKLLDTLLVLLALLLAAWGLLGSSLSAVQGTQALTAAIFVLLLAWYFRAGREG